MTALLWGISSQDLYEKITTKYDEITSFIADMESSSYFSDLDHTTQSQGKIYFDKNNLHIAYFSPNKETISLHDSVIYIYQSQEDRLIITYADSSFVSLNLEYLIKKVWDADKVNIQELDKSYNVSIELTESNSLANINQIEFEVSKSTSLIERLQYGDFSNNKVNISFSNILLNKSPDDEDYWLIETNEDTQIIDYRN
jgi:outer membrane lipoprotein-sorting protein